MKSNKSSLNSKKTVSSVKKTQQETKKPEPQIKKIQQETKKTDQQTKKTEPQIKKTMPEIQKNSLQQNILDQKKIITEEDEKKMLQGEIHIEQKENLTEEVEFSDEVPPRLLQTEPNDEEPEEEPKKRG